MGLPGEKVPLFDAFCGSKEDKALKDRVAEMIPSLDDILLMHLDYKELPSVGDREEEAGVR